MKIEMEMPEPPEGFEYTGEYQEPKDGEYIMDDDGTPFEFQDSVVGSYPILRKLKPKREFKGGAFYPAIYENVRITITYAGHTEGKVFFDIIGSRNQYFEDDFSWIGEELDIKWGE